MPTFDPTYSTGQSVPGGGMTLEEIMQRRRDLARTQLGFSQVATPTIAGGIGNMISAFTTGLQEHQAQQQEAQGRQALAGAYSRIDPNTGQFANPQDQALAMMLDPQGARSMISSAVANMQAIAAEKQREAYESGLPQTPRAKAMADYTSGKFGTVGSPEAITARDAAIRASEAPELSLSDRQYLDQNNAENVKATSQLESLKRAVSLLNQGIYSTAGGSLWEQVGKFSRYGDKEMANLSDEFYTLVASGELNDLMSKATSPDEIRRFQDTLTEPNSTPEARKQALMGMMNRVEAYNNEIKRRITKLDPNAQLQGPASNMSLQEEEQTLQNARDRIAASSNDPGVIADIKNKLKTVYHIDPGRL